MATFNTAFGALQTPQDVANRSTQPTTGIRLDRMANVSLPGQQQMQAQMQAQQQKAQQPAQQPTFAQMQQAGQARPAPAAPVSAPQPQMLQRLGGAMGAQAQPQVPQFGGSQQAMQLRNQLQQQLQQFQQAPTRFDLPAFQQIRSAQQGMLQREFGAQQQAINEEMARRGLSASSITAGRFGDLAGQQALAQAQIDAQLLQEAARTQAEDRANLLLQMSQLAELSGAQDLAAYQAQLAGQQQQFAQGLQQAGITGQLGGAQTLEAQRLAEEQRQFDMQQQLQERLGIAGITGTLPGEGEGPGTLTLAAQEIATQRASQLSQQTGLSYTVDASGNVVADIDPATGQQRTTIQAQELGFRRSAEETQQAQQRAAQLSQQTGLSYKVDDRGDVVADIDPRTGQQRTTVEAQALELRQQEIDARAEEFRQEQALRGRQVSVEEARQQAEKEIAIANITGTITVGEKEVSTLAAERLGQERLQTAIARADQLSRSTGNVYTINDDGEVVEQVVNGEPVKTESALARLSQEALQKAQLTGEFLSDDGTVVSTLAAQQLKQDEYNARVMQALQQSEATGLMYRVNDDGEVVLDADENGEPVSTEQRRAQMQQEKSARIQEGIRKADLLSAQTGLSYTIDDLGNVTADIDPATKQQRTTLQAQEMQQRKALAEAELTGQMEIDGKKVSTLAYQRLGEERVANALQQAAQQSQATGNVYVINDEGDVEQLTDAGGNPVRTESSLARLSQQALQEAELKGFFTDNTRVPPIQISTVAARSLNNQELEALTRRAALMSEMEGKVYEINDQGELVATDRDTEQVRANQARELAQQRQNALLEARALSENSGLSWVLNGDGEVVRDIDPETGQQRTTEQARQFGLEIEQRKVEARERTELLRFELLFSLAQALGISTSQADLARILDELSSGDGSSVTGTSSGTGTGTGTGTSGRTPTTSSRTSPTLQKGKSVAGYTPINVNDQPVLTANPSLFNSLAAALGQPQQGATALPIRATPILRAQ